ncbi:hypothetical protein M433DRAFT_135190 [Acidomyces richmondensis BFW]|nr:MAG: hypothetical protein FE78DRAFT_541590 [Acidomyces sp. 'richmondensis']KYG44866.1 hypothetical protein M433DRAFT_135190 [Acidomyces richmondensis BFW]
MNYLRTTQARDSSARRSSGCASRNARRNGNRFRGSVGSIAETSDQSISYHILEANQNQGDHDRGPEHRREMYHRFSPGFVPILRRGSSIWGILVETTSDSQPQMFSTLSRNTSSRIRENDQITREVLECHHRRCMAILSSFQRQSNDNLSHRELFSRKPPRSEFVLQFIRTPFWQGEREIRARQEMESIRKIHNLLRQYESLSGHENNNRVRRTSRSNSEFREDNSPKNHAPRVVNGLGSMDLEDLCTQLQNMEAKMDELILDRAPARPHDHFNQEERIFNAMRIYNTIYHHRRHHNYPGSYDLTRFLQLRNSNESYDPNYYINLPAVGASTAEEHRLSEREVSEEDRGEDGRATCPICMEEVQTRTSVTVMPCGHWYHHDCISEWLKENRSCALCRTSIKSRAHRLEDPY